tara:strand:- start:324 stop:503 length:180 start_codon:yes stop_codon:yes gene_type:complete
MKDGLKGSEFPILKDDKDSKIIKLLKRIDFFMVYTKSLEKKIKALKEKIKKLEEERKIE